MSVRFALDQLGVTFDVSVVDCMNGQPFDSNDIIDQKIVFYKPDGITFEKDATLQNPTNPPTAFIQYINTTPELSILDLRGAWEYTGKITLTTTDTTQLSQRRVFWVS